MINIKNCKSFSCIAPFFHNENLLQSSNITSNSLFSFYNATFDQKLQIKTTFHIRLDGKLTKQLCNL